MGLINDLARIREMSGREPLPDPRVIAGFEPGSPPPPPYIPTEGSGVPKEWLEPEPEPKSPPSPLVPRRAKPEPVEPAVAPSFLLVVLDGLASWKGRDVQLTDREVGSIRGIVLRAIQREVQADLEAAATLGGSEPPKKRGRPKKAKA